MLGVTLFGLNTSGWLKESHRSQQEYLDETDRSIVQACIVELRNAAKATGSLAAC